MTNSVSSLRDFIFSCYRSRILSPLRGFDHRNQHPHSHQNQNINGDIGALGDDEGEGGGFGQARELEQSQPAEVEDAESAWGEGDDQAELGEGITGEECAPVRFEADGLPHEVETEGQRQVERDRPSQRDQRSFLRGEE